MSIKKFQRRKRRVLFVALLSCIFVILLIMYLYVRIQHNKEYKRLNSIPEKKGVLSPTPKPDISKWKTYSDEVNQISFKYPDEWYYEKDANIANRIEFFKIGEEEIHAWLKPDSNYQLTVNIIQDTTYDELVKEKQLPQTQINGRMAMVYTTGAYILLKTRPDKILWIQVTEYPSLYLSTILSTLVISD